MSAPGIPILKDELDRKSMEAVEFLFNGYHIGKVTLPQLSTGLDALFMATAGLVDSGVIDLISAGSTMIDLNKDKLVDKRVLYGADGTVIALTRKLGDDSFVVDIYRGGKRVKQEVKEYVLAKQANDAMENLAGKLLANGYAEL